MSLHLGGTRSKEALFRVLLVRVCLSSNSSLRALQSGHSKGKRANSFPRAPLAVKQGDRVAQLILERSVTPDVQEVESLAETDRGAGGFGSTGGFGAVAGVAAEEPVPVAEPQNGSKSS